MIAAWSKMFAAFPPHLLGEAHGQSVESGEIEDAIEQANLVDLGELLGHRPDSREDGDRELERFVLADAADGRHHEALVALAASHRPLSRPASR